MKVKLDEKEILKLMEDINIALSHHIHGGLFLLQHKYKYDAPTAGFILIQTLKTIIGVIEESHKVSEVDYELTKTRTH